MELTKESATTILKDWLAIARGVAGKHANLHEQIGINRYRLTKLISVKHEETPTPDELAKFSTALGYPAHDLAIIASMFLHPDILKIEFSKEKPRECKIDSRQELKAWLKAARLKGRSGRLTQGQLGERIGRTMMSVASWESTTSDRVPKSKDIKAIAEACGVPEPIITFDTRSSTTDGAMDDFGIPRTLDEEILRTGYLLSRRAHNSTNAERNAYIFRARYGGSGEDESTLQAIGDVYGVTRERIRQIVDKQLNFSQAITLKTECFDALATACLVLEPITVSVAEYRLRHLLGGTLSLKGASDYGREVLGKPLPIQLTPIRNGETIVIAGDLPPWFQNAISQSKAIIRHCGAAQFNLVWALTMREHQDWIPPDQFRQVIAHAPGFDWIDDDAAWYWFGPEGSANRLVKWAIDILMFAKRPLDIEIIYGGLTRYTRTRDSDIHEEAGIWPPVEVVRKLLMKSPALVCQQGDDFRLAAEQSEYKTKNGVAELILAELKLRGGLASRSELHQVLVLENGMNTVSFSVALAHSPLLRQVDRSIFAIRGWPISAVRLTEAQNRVGNLVGPRVNFKEVDVTSNGEVSWVNTISVSSMSNQYAGIPSKALFHLPQGQYTVDGKILTITDERMVGLIRLVVAKGGSAGTLYRTTVNGRTRTAKVEIIGQEDQDDEDLE